MKRTLYPMLLLAAVASLALPAVAADLGGPVCSDQAPPPAAVEGAAAEPARDLQGPAEPLALGGPIGPIPPQQCGLVTCPVGTRCCNPLCSACTPPGVECTLGDCGHGPTS
jgi:hypothetical protein